MCQSLHTYIYTFVLHRKHQQLYEQVTIKNISIYLNEVFPPVLLMLVFYVLKFGNNESKQNHKYSEKGFTMKLSLRHFDSRVRRDGWVLIEANVPFFWIWVVDENWILKSPSQIVKIYHFFILVRYAQTHSLLPVSADISIFTFFLVEVNRFHCAMFERDTRCTKHCHMLLFFSHQIFLVLMGPFRYSQEFLLLLWRQIWIVVTLRTTSPA